MTSPDWLWIRWDPTPRLLCRLTPCPTAPRSLCLSFNRNLSLCPPHTHNLTTASWTYPTTCPNLYCPPIHPPYNHINRDKTTTRSSEREREIWIQTEITSVKLDYLQMETGSGWLRNSGSVQTDWNEAREFECYNLTVTTKNDLVFVITTCQYDITHFSRLMFISVSLHLKAHLHSAH